MSKINPASPDLIDRAWYAVGYENDSYKMTNPDADLVGFDAGAILQYIAPDCWADENGDDCTHLIAEADFLVFQNVGRS